MSAAPTRVDRNGLVIGNCYSEDNGKYLGRLTRIDVAQVPYNNGGGLREGMNEQKTCVFELKTVRISGFGFDGGPYFKLVECRGGEPAVPSPVPLAAVGGAGGGGASSVSSSTSYTASVAVSLSEKLITNLRTARMDDGTSFVAEKRTGTQPYIQVKVLGPEIIANISNVPIYKINVSDLTITKLSNIYPDTTAARLAFLNTIVAEFRPRANNSGRRSSRKHRKSRRSTRKRNTGRRKN